MRRTSDPSEPLGRALACLTEGSEAAAYFDLCSRAAVHGFSAEREGCAVLLRSPGVKGSVLFDRILGLGCQEAATREQFQRAIDPYVAAGTAFAVEVSPLAEPADLLIWMKDRGLRKISASQVLFQRASSPKVSYASWAQATGLRVEEVGEEAREIHAAIACENFRMPPNVGLALAAGCSGPGWRRWLAFDNDVPVGGSLSFVVGDVAWLGWTSVLPSHRGRWVHSGIVARQLEDCFKAGCAWVTTETAQSSAQRPDAAYVNLRKFGFQDAYLRSSYVWVPPRVRS